MRFKHWILAPGNLNEMGYEGNLGFEELVKFYQVADKKQIKEMEKSIKDEDGKSFKALVKKVLGVSLK